MTGKWKTTWLSALMVATFVSTAKADMERYANLTAEEQVAVARRYFLGDGVPQDGARAYKLYHLAAEKGHPEGSNGVGACYAKGIGVKQDDGAAMKWFLKAARAGSAKAQLNAAYRYWEGTGVAKDTGLALVWAWVSASNGYEPAIAVAVGYAGKMKAPDILAAHAAAKAWLAREMPRVNLADLTFDLPGRPAGNGTAFFVGRDGHLLTAAHVVRGQRNVWIFCDGRFYPAEVAVRADPRDLAVLRTYVKRKGLAVRGGDSVGMGETVFTVGFPNIDLQGISPKLTQGEISSIGGLRDAPDVFQISVPVQPGNSGGALADARGDVVGVISARLDEWYQIRQQKALPQNVNYAAKLQPDKPPLTDIPGLETAPGRPENLQGSIARNTVSKVEAATVMVLTFR